jgi:hypothetical protein
VQLFKHDVQELRRELKQQLSGADKKGKGKAKDVGIDYGHDTGFEWGKALKGQMKRVFGIDNFRLCQEGCVAFPFFFLGLRSSYEDLRLFTESATRTWTDGISSASCPRVAGSP